MPLGVVQRIAHLARGRRIPGTNKYARVCRQWRDASNSDEAEQLQLLVDLHIMSAEEVARACSWMSMHGRSVQTLLVSAEGMAPPPQTWFTTAAAAAALGNLRRLEVHQGHSLLMLVPVLGQLPHLQHLGAAVAVVADPHKSWQVAPGKEMVEGVLMDRHFHPWQPLPDMQRLCPQLTHLHLRLDVEVESYAYDGMGDYDGDVTVDKRLAQLLPATLQHLTLCEGMDCGHMVVLHPTSLTHLKALQQLTLRCVEMDAAGCQAAAQRLTALQELRVRGCRWGVTAHDPMLLLAPKLVEYTPCRSLTAAAFPQLVHLTKLVWDSAGSMFQGAAEALAACTALQELRLEAYYMGGPGSEVAAVVRRAAGMPQLRSLQLDGSVDSIEDMAASLAQYTQLTSLSLWIRDREDTCMCVPQQLTGLKCLTVPWQLVEQEAGAWLAPLTALTRLCVELDRSLEPPAPTGNLLDILGAYSDPQWQQQLGPRHQARAQEALQQVQVWPPRLQQLVIWVPQRLAGRGVAPRRWQHTPAAPGSAPFTVFFEEGGRYGSSQVAEGWARPLSPCPHLPGVQELAGEVQGG
jgi:hypothetical protein